MKLFDQHLHSRHSFDSQTEPVANVEAALAKGLAGLSLTEHYDTHPNDWPECIYDDGAIRTTIEQLRATYSDRIFVGKGIEVCFQPTQLDRILDHLRRHTFDVVLLSVHYFGGQPAHVKASWEGVEPEVGLRRYLDGVLDAVRSVERLHRKQGHVFDVLSHLDFAKRYAKRFCGSFDMKSHEGVIEKIMQTCLEADLVPEINTSTLRQGLGEAMPNLDAVKAYARLGGKAMSLGSDAHRAEDIGADFDQAVAMLREAGIGKTLVFQQRERREIPVDTG